MSSERQINVLVLDKKTRGLPITQSIVERIEMPVANEERDQHYNQAPLQQQPVIGEQRDNSGIDIASSSSSLSSPHHQQTRQHQSTTESHYASHLPSDSLHVGCPTRKFYALVQGKSTQRCIYLEEHDFLPQIDGYPDAQYAIFHNWEGACQYISESRPISVARQQREQIGDSNPEEVPLVQTSEEDDEHHLQKILDETAQWEMKYKELVHYYNTHGTSDVPAHTILGHFAARQKLEYVAFLNGKHSSLTQDRIDRLRAVDFSFGGHRDRKTFQRYVEELSRYREKHGGQDPPPGSMLSKWVMSMQKRYLEFKRGKDTIGGMDKVKCDALERLGFEWTRTPITNELVKEVTEGTPETFQPLQIVAVEAESPAAHGRDQISDGAMENVIPPSEWDMGQAEPTTNVNMLNEIPNVYPHGETNNLLLPMPNMLSISFDNNGSDQTMTKKRKAEWMIDENWDEIYEELKDFKTKNGHCIPPVQPATKLRHWVDKIRTEYKKLRAGSSSALTAQRLQKLNDIDFQFERKIKPRTWEERYEELVRFKENFGHCRVPRLFNQPTYEGLGKWVADQRMKYNYMLQGKKSNMTPERAQKLSDLGMVWAVFKLPPKEDRAERKPWDHRYVELLEFKRQHGHTLVPQAFPILGQWVHTQRVNYKLMKQGRKSAMTPEQAVKLEQIGFAFEYVLASGIV